MTQSKPTKPENQNTELAARVMAVQAYYQISQNNRPVREVVNEYVQVGLQTDAEEEEGAEEIETLKAHNGLFKRILTNLDSRLAEVDEILKGAVHKKNAEDVPEKELEPLLKAVLMCGITELLEHQDVDTALIVDDYLNVTHGFYAQGQVSFVNGILDNVAKMVRA